MIMAVWSGLACAAAFAQEPQPAAVDANTPVAAPPVPVEAEPVQPALDRALKVRDPFKQPMMTVGKKAVSELETIAVENFTLLGVMTGPLRTKAMLTAAGAGGKTFFVTEGTKIGIRKGVVKRIDPTEIIVREKVLNYLGVEETVEAKIVAQEKSNEVIQTEMERLKAQGGAGSGFNVGAAWLSSDALTGETAPVIQPLQPMLPQPAAPVVPQTGGVPVLSPGSGSP